MKVIINVDDGEVIAEYDFHKYVKDAARDWPADDNETHRAIALGDLLEDVEAGIRVWAAE